MASNRPNPRPTNKSAARRVQFGVAALAIAALLGFVLFQGISSRPAAEGRAQPGRPAPSVELTDFDGQRFSLAEYRGTPLVVNFWASWCPNCVAEMPDFEKVHQALKGEVEFVGIDQRDARGPAEDLARETGVTYRLAEDPSGAVFDAFGGLGMPTTAFIDADGNVVDVVTGQLSEGQLRDFITRSFGIEA